MSKRQVKTVYLVGPIEFSKNPDSEWRYVLEGLLKTRGIASINPVKTSYLVGKDIEENGAYVRGLKKKRNWKDFRSFMKKIWGQNKTSVDSADILVCWVREKKELLELNASGGSFREFCRGKRKNKPTFLICETDLGPANSHMLDVIMSRGAIFGNVTEMLHCIEDYNKTGKWDYVN